MPEQEFYYLIFDGGIETPAKLVREGGKTKLRCDLPHLNPDAIMHVMSENDLRVSSSVISSMRVVSIEQEQSSLNLALRIHVVMQRALKNDPNPLPQVGDELYLMPENSSGKIKVLCLDRDETNHTIIAAYYLDHLRLGCEAWIRNEPGKKSRIKIEDIELICENSGVNLSYCDLEISEAVKKTSSTAPEKDSTTKEEPVKEVDPTPAPDDVGSVEKPRSVPIGPRAKTALLMMLASLLTALSALLLMPAGAGQEARTPEAATTTVQSSLAAGHEETTKLTSVMIADPAERKTIPLTARRLLAFFGQSDPAKLTGRLIGEVEPGRLGIYCDKTPAYDSNSRTSDATGCEISLPEDAKPGTYPLTAKNSLNWFHQEDPSCFRESLTPYPITDTGDGLRIHLDACTWVFDPVRKCFDYSRCTFTVPRFDAE